MITDQLHFQIDGVVTDSKGMYCWHLDIFVCNVTITTTITTTIAITTTTAATATTTTTTTTPTTTSSTTCKDSCTSCILYYIFIGSSSFKFLTNTHNSAGDSWSNTGHCLCHLDCDWPCHTDCDLCGYQEKKTVSRCIGTVDVHEVYGCVNKEYHSNYAWYIS